MPSTENNLQRRIYIDSLKGFAIFTVVVGHAIQYSSENYDEQWLFRYIYSFHMPLFMFLSGIVTRVHPAATIQLLTAKFQRLVIPFFFWLPISYFSIKYIQQPAQTIGSLTDFVMQAMKSPDAGGLWFLLVLFECHAIIAMIRGGLQRIPATTFAVFLLFLNTLVIFAPSLDWLGLGLLRWYLLFFAAGVIANKTQMLNVSGATTTVAAAIFLLGASMWTRKGLGPLEYFASTHSGLAHQLLTQAYHLVVASAAIVATLGLAQKFANNLGQTLTRFLTTLGKYSIAIYAGHYLFLYAATNWSKNHFQTMGQANIAGITIFAIVGSMLLARAIGTIPTIHRLAYGR